MQFDRKRYLPRSGHEAPRGTIPQGRTQSCCVRRGRYAMQSALISLMANHISIFATLREKTGRQRWPCRLALAIVLGLAGISPSAQAQTFTVLYSFTGGTDGYLPAFGLLRDSAGNLYGSTFRGGDPTCVATGSEGFFS